MSWKNVILDKKLKIACHFLVLFSDMKTHEKTKQKTLPQAQIFINPPENVKNYFITNLIYDKPSWNSLIYPIKFW